MRFCPVFLSCIRSYPACEIPMNLTLTIGMIFTTIYAIEPALHSVVQGAPCHGKVVILPRGEQAFHAIEMAVRLVGIAIGHVIDHQT